VTLGAESGVGLQHRRARHGVDARIGDDRRRQPFRLRRVGPHLDEVGVGDDGSGRDRADGHVLVEDRTERQVVERADRSGGRRATRDQEREQGAGAG